MNEVVITQPALGLTVTPRNSVRMGRSNVQKAKALEKRRAREARAPPPADTAEKAPKPRCLENAEFEAYYRGQGFVPEGEWEDFLSTLRRPLGVAFRITGNPQDPAALAIRDQLEKHVAGMAALVVGGEPVPAPEPISWYPGRMAWRFDVSRAVLRGKGLKNEQAEPPAEERASRETVSYTHLTLPTICSV